MKQFGNYEEAKKAAQAQGGAKLPAGAYVCKVMNVRYEEGEPGKSDRIVIQFDIDEGEQKGFFKKKYDGDTSDQKTWKGKTNIYVPSDDGSEKDGWTKKSFANWTDSFEKSNNGYLWDWDESKWKGKLIGIVFGDTGANVNGKDIIYTEPRFPVAVSKVRDGSAPVAKFKSRDGYGSGAAASASGDDFMKLPDNADEFIPF